MTKLKFIVLSLFAIGCFAASVGLVVSGYGLASRNDVACGDWVMQPGDRCENFSSRGGSWFNDYDQQRRRNHEEGLQWIAVSAVLFVISGAFAFGLGYARRYAKRQGGELDSDPPAPVELVRNRTYQTITLAVATVIASIYPVGMLLLGDAGWQILLVVPFTLLVLVYLTRKYLGKNTSRNATTVRPDGDPPPYIELR